MTGSLPQGMYNPTGLGAGFEVRRGDTFQVHTHTHTRARTHARTHTHTVTHTHTHHDVTTSQHLKGDTICTIEGQPPPTLRVP